MKCLLLVGLTSVLLTYPFLHPSAAEASTYQASCQEELAHLTISGIMRPPVQLEPFHIMILAFLATFGIVGLWGIFWCAFLKSQDSGKIMDVLNASSFLKTVTVVGVIAAAAVLSLAGILEGNVAGGRPEWNRRLCSWAVVK